MFILLVIWVWADQLTAMELLINSNNLAFVDILNAKSSKSECISCKTIGLIMHEI